MKPDIILIGGGGHCQTCIDVIEAEGIYRIAGIVDLAEKKGRDIFGYPYIGTDDDLPDLVNPHTHFLITLGQIKTPAKRIALFEKLKALGGTLPVIQSPLAHVSRHADIQEGTIIMHHALVNAGARVGRNCIVNTKALLEHDVVIEDHCHIATGAVVNGQTKVKAGSFLGSNSVCLEGITIGSKCVVGGGGESVKESSSAQHIHKPLKIAIFGASGFSREAADVALIDDIKELVFVDVKPKQDSYYGYQLVKEEYVPSLEKEGFLFVVGLGDNSIRKKVFLRFRDLKFPNLVHPKSNFGSQQKERLLEVHGNIITAGSVFTNNINFGNFGIYNLNCTVGHDCIIDDFVNIAPGVNVSGNVHISEGAYIGTNAAILQGKALERKIIIGNYSTVGGSALVSKSVEQNDIVVGVPAKSIKK